MENDFVYAPVGNTGVVYTENIDLSLIDKREINDLGQYVLIDWLEFTIHYDLGSYIYAHNSLDNEYIDMLYAENYVRKLFKDLFNIIDLSYSKSGKNGYNCNYSYKNIHAYISNYVNMGVHFEITGQGCRELDDLNINLYELLDKLQSYNAKYSRIDLSIDDFTNKYYTVNKIKKYLNNKLIVGKFRTYYNTTSGLVEDNKLLGNTIQLGSKASLVHITFYDKLLEREANNYVLDSKIKYWTRTEVRFRHEKACDIANNLIRYRQINCIVKGVLNDYIRFVEKPKSNDKNKSRWSTSIWWSDFLENINKLELLPIKTFTSIQRKRNWLKEDVSKSEFMVILSEIDDFKADECLSDLLFTLIKHGYSNIKDSDISLINDERISKNREIITRDEIDSYIRDIQTVCLIKNNNNYLE